MGINLSINNNKVSLHVAGLEELNTGSVAHEWECNSSRKHVHVDKSYKLMILLL